MDDFFIKAIAMFQAFKNIIGHILFGIFLVMKHLNRIILNCKKKLYTSCFTYQNIRTFENKCGMLFSLLYLYFIIKNPQGFKV